MFRQSLARLYSSFGQQRKLFLLVFLWTCLCLVIFKSTLFNTNNNGSPLEQQGAPQEQRGAKMYARAAHSSVSPLYLAPEFALPDNNNNNALYYSLSSISAATSLPPSDNKSVLRQGNKVPTQKQSYENSSSSSSAGSKLRSSTTNKQQHKLNEFIAGSQCNYDYPSLFDLQFNNIHWQKLTTFVNDSSKKNSQPHSNETSLATYYLYNAYYDDRWRGGLPSIRILAMIDRIQPPPTNCLLWSSKLAAPAEGSQRKLKPLVSRASFVYAWYPKWGNYKDGLLQPWIVTCPMPRAHVGLVPDSVSLIGVPLELNQGGGGGEEIASVEQRSKRQVEQAASIAMPPSFSSSPSSARQQVLLANGTATGSQQTTASSQELSTRPMQTVEYDCQKLKPITNNLPVYNQRPQVKGKFAVCVKGLDFPHEDVSVRLIEWIELLNLLGAGKIFLYNLDVHENISKVLHYYQKRGIVELSPLTLPGDQPNLPEYQHLYLKNRLTAKRQNELIPYNDCLYRNLNSYQYLALLDIDEIIMPLKENNWFDLMQDVEKFALAEQNYSRASYNVRNVYFFDDLAGPLGTTSSSSPSSDQNSDEDDNNNEEAPNSSSSVKQLDSLERGIPHYLHMMQHVYRSKNYTKPGQYVKCFHNTERVVSLHNHFPMNCFGQCTTYSIPVQLAHLQHYRKDCVGPLKQSCKNDYRAFTQRDTTIWKYKQQMIKRTTRVLNHLGLLVNSNSETTNKQSSEPIINR